MATHSRLLPGKFHGWRSLVGYSPGGHKELDTTERLHFLSLSPESNHEETNPNSESFCKTTSLSSTKMFTPYRQTEGC